MLKQNPDIEFNDLLHQYTVNGVIMPSVSNIKKPLDNFDHVPASVLQIAAQKGTDKHNIIKYYHKGTLDHGSLTPEYAEFLKRYSEWFIPQDHPSLKLISELPMYHPNLGYCGTPDLILDDCLVDFKSGAINDLSCGVQLAAYADMIEASLGIKIKHRLILFQDGKGRFKTKSYKSKDDYRIFRRLLQDYRNIQDAQLNLLAMENRRQGFVNQLLRR